MLLRSINVKMLQSVIKILIVSVLLSWVLFQIDLGRAISMLSRIRLNSIIFVIVALIFQAGLSALRWSIISSLVGPVLPLSKSFSLFMTSLFYNQVLPSTLPGDAIRILGAAQCDIRLESAAAGVVLDRLFTLSGLIFMGCISELIVRILNQSGLPVPYFFEFTLFCCMALVFFYLALVENWRGLPLAIVSFIPDSYRIKDIILLTKGSFKHFEIIKVMLIIFLTHSMSIIAIYKISLGLGLPISLYKAFLVLPAVLLIAVIPTSIAGWGVRETAMILSLSSLGIQDTDAVVLSVIFGLAQLLIGLFGVLFILFPLKAAPGMSQ